MKAYDIREHFLSVGDWVDPETTVDRIIIGDPQADVSRLLVTWISSFEAVREAVRRGCQMLITHEPTFWVHANEMETVEGWDPASVRGELAGRKRRFIEENDLVILRVHDAWDRMPEVGIPFAWARHLGLGAAPTAISECRYQHRYDIDPMGLDDFARRLAARTATLGEPAVQVVGAPDRVVSRVGAGTGCACDIETFRQMGCDVSIVCDDGTRYWGEIQLAADAEHPVIRVSHGTSEEPGMATLAAYVNETLPGVTAEHLPHGASFRLMG